MNIYVIFQTQRVPVDRLCAVFPQQRRENRHPRLCSHVAGEQLYHLNYIVNQLYHDIFIILTYLIFVISFTQTGFSKTKFYTQKNN